MFGFIQPDFRALQKEELNEYRSVYCGVCHEIKEYSGLISTLGLKYDYTFLAFLGLSLQHICVRPEKSHCHLCNLKRRDIFIEPGLYRNIAEIAAMLQHLKLTDDRRDSHKGKPVPRRFANKNDQQLSFRQSSLYMELVRLNEQQYEKECENCTEFDAILDPSAKMLAEICKTIGSCPKESERCYNFGYLLGRWIYLMDAAKDRKKDQRSGDYNIFNRLEMKQEEIEGILNLTLNEVYDTFDEIELETHRGILNNIVYKGLKHQQALVLRGK